MSDKTYFQTRRQQVLGSISGWDRLTTAEPEDSTHIPSNDHLYTLPDLYLMMKKIMSRIDPDQIEYLIQSIQEHINDKDNPHQTSLDKMSTSVIKEMYNLWIDEGYIGTEDQFLKQLFQYVKIADLETTLAGEALDQVPSVYTAARLVEKHDQSLDAHANLITSMFPGTPLQGPPTYAILGLVSQAKIPDDVIVERSGSIWVCNSFGHLEEVPANTIKPDWTLGEPALPIFDEYANSLYYSEDFSKFPTETNINKLKGSGGVTIEKSTSIYSPRVPDEFVWYLRETQDTKAVPHYLSYATDVTKDKVYTFSIYVKPVNRRGVKIKILPRVSGVFAPITNTNDDEGKLSFLAYDFVSKEIYVPTEVTTKGTMTGGMAELASGWWRVWITFKAQSTERSINIFFYLSDILGGDFGYIGNGASGAGVFGHQFSSVSTITPYLPTGKGQRYCGATKIKVPLNEEWFNKDASTVIVEVSNSRNTTIHNNNLNEVYTLAGDTTESSMKVSLSCFYPTTTTAHKPWFSAFSDETDNSEVASGYGNLNTSLRSVLGQSFDNTSVITLSTGGDPITYNTNKKISTKSKYFYLGCSATNDKSVSTLNGYLFRFEYYPFKCTEDNLKYFLEDPILAKVVEVN